MKGLLMLRVEAEDNVENLPVCLHLNVLLQLWDLHNYAC